MACMSILSFTIKRDFIRVWITRHPNRSLRWMHSYPHFHTIHKKIKNQKEKITITIVSLLSKQWGTTHMSHSCWVKTLQIHRHQTDKVLQKEAQSHNQF
jgi:hypothetical protein